MDDDVPSLNLTYMEQKVSRYYANILKWCYFIIVLQEKAMEQVGRAAVDRRSAGSLRSTGAPRDPSRMAVVRSHCVPAGALYDG